MNDARTWVGGAVAVSPQQPVGVVGLDEATDHLSGLADVGQALTVEALLAQGAPEPLGNAVALGFIDEGRRGPDAEERDLA